MITSGLLRNAVLPALIVVVACGPLFGSGSEDPEPSERDGVFHERGGIVVTGVALQDGPGNVLAAMAGKVPNFRVLHQGNECPEISLRSHVNYTGFVNPHVYVDGTRATDTCVLESLRAHDVSRVEVYPLGFTTRPGYGRHAHGLILVFMRSG